MLWEGCTSARMDAPLRLQLEGAEWKEQRALSHFSGHCQQEQGPWFIRCHKPNRRKPR